MNAVTRREALVRLSALTTTVAGAGVPRLARAMMPRDLSNVTAVQAVGAMRRGDISAEDYAKFCLMRCEALKHLNAFITLQPDKVLEAARTADKKRAAGAPLGPLHGLPLAIKDNIDTAGTTTTAGTPALRRHVPKTDAPVLTPLLQAGAYVLGKTNLHELAYGYTTNNGAFGPTRNPYDSDRIPGGSSGGTAVAIAARMIPAGLGTDTVGSVRVPAALCGIAGLRPTAGRYPVARIAPISHTRDTAGPMARTVADLVLLDSVIAGDAKAVEPLPLKGLRLGVSRAYFYADLDEEVERVTEAALGKLAKAGAVLVEAEFDFLEPDAFQRRVCRSIQLFETRGDFAEYLTDTGAPASFQDVTGRIASPGVKTVFDTLILGPNAVKQETYDRVMGEYRPRLQSAYRSHFQQHALDAVIFPTTQVPALPIGQEVEFEVRGKKFPLVFFGRNVDPGTCAGLPGLSLPAGLTRDGLPSGLAIDAPAGADRRLLAIGLSLEQALGKIPAPPT